MDQDTEEMKGHRAKMLEIMTHFFTLVSPQPPTPYSPPHHESYSPQLPRPYIRDGLCCLAAGRLGYVLLRVPFRCGVSVVGCEDEGLGFGVWKMLEIVTHFFTLVTP